MFCPSCVSMWQNCFTFSLLYQKCHLSCKVMMLFCKERNQSISSFLFIVYIVSYAEGWFCFCGHVVTRNNYWRVVSSLSTWNSKLELKAVQVALLSELENCDWMSGFFQTLLNLSAKIQLSEMEGIFWWARYTTKPRNVRCT